jgi:hypothetical protein
MAACTRILSQLLHLLREEDRVEEVLLQGLVSPSSAFFRRCILQHVLHCVAHSTGIKESYQSRDVA